MRDEERVPEVLLPQALFEACGAGQHSIRSAINPGAYDRLLPVDGYTAQDSGRTVSLYLAAVDVGQ